MLEGRPIEVLGPAGQGRGPKGIRVLPMLNNSDKGKDPQLFFKFIGFLRFFRQMFPTMTLV